MHTATELAKFVDKFLKEHGLGMTQREFYNWEKKSYDYVNKMPSSFWEDKSQKARCYNQYQEKKQKYERVMKLAKEEWLLSTDGVVKALRYRAKDKQFVARVHYKEWSNVVEEHLNVSDDWVIDMYGKDIAKKLIDCEENKDFITPLTEDGMLATLKVDKCKIIRVKYYPPKYAHIYDNGKDEVTDEIHTEAVWKGLMDDGQSVSIREDVIRAQFGSMFVQEMKTLGVTKYVPIPVGSCRSSIMKIFPELRCEKAPPVKFMQGEMDTCVFSSLASAFHQTSIPDLVRVANILQTKSKKLCGGTKSMTSAKKIVADNVKWLEAKRLLPNTFSWEEEINDYMFVVGIIKDNTNCCQHAITIFRNWIYDSNEPFALPLSKESLDYCTWEIEKGKIKNASMFECFIGGWIFQEPEGKKKKKLDMCAKAPKVKQA
jgi:hypothetical protein